MELGYWGIKGVAEPIRWLIAYTGMDVHEYTPASSEEWFGSKKSQVGGPFPNLPYLIDGDFRLTESTAIPYYLIKKSGKTELLGKDIVEESVVRQIEGVIGDIRQNVFKAMFTEGGSAQLKTSITKCFEEGGSTRQKLQLLSKYLGDKEYFLGHVTYADILFTYFAEFVSSIALSNDVECPLCAYKNLCELIKRVRGLNGIKERYEASKQVPFMPPQILSFKMLNSAEIEQKQAASKQ